jgi:hypothetical protein
MFKAFNAFITTLFTAMNSFALALGHMAAVAEETAGAFADESRSNRAAQALELNKQLKLTAKVDKATA